MITAALVLPYLHNRKLADFPDIEVYPSSKAPPATMSALPKARQKGALAREKRTHG